MIWSQGFNLFTSWTSLIWLRNFFFTIMTWVRFVVRVKSDMLEISRSWPNWRCDVTLRFFTKFELYKRFIVKFRCPYKVNILYKADVCIIELSVIKILRFAVEFILFIKLITGWRVLVKFSKGPRLLWNWYSLQGPGSLQGRDSL